MYINSWIYIYIYIYVYVYVKHWICIKIIAYFEIFHEKLLLVAIKKIVKRGYEIP